MKMHHLLTAVMLVSSFVTATAQTAPPLLSYQGRITAHGTNFHGAGQFKFALVDGISNKTYWCAGGGSWNGSEPGMALTIPVNNGLFSLSLGDLAMANMIYPIPADIFTNADVRLRIWFSDGINSFQQLRPDQRLTSAGYAMGAERANYAATARLAESVSPTADLQALRLNVGTNNQAEGQLASISGGMGNTISPYTAFASIGGGQGNSVSGYTSSFSTIGGGASNQVTGLYGTVGGGFLNQASGMGATVGGGGTDGQQWSDPTIPGNIASGNASTISGGYANRAKGNESTIGGGAFNIAGLEITDYAATVAGGHVNQAAGSCSTVGGGANNLATNTYATVAGGWNNLAVERATVGGGTYNFATNTHATIAGGSDNRAQGIGATIGGGGHDGFFYEGNRALGTVTTVAGGIGNVASNRAATVSGGEYNQALGEAAFVGGGKGNIALGAGAVVSGGGYDGDLFRINSARGVAATVAGGIANQAEGDFSTVAGGAYNTAAGAGSFAAGRNTHAAEGSFVWSDGQSSFIGNPFGNPYGSNQFLVHASGGVGINTAHTPEGGLVVNTNAFLRTHDLFFNPYEDERTTGLGWYGPGKPFGLDWLWHTAPIEPNGPVLYGKEGGALGTVGSGTNVALVWGTNSLATIPPLMAWGGITTASLLAYKASFADNISIQDHDLRLRSDENHGLGWYGWDKPFGTNDTIDGPVLYGFSGGALGITSFEQPRAVLQWAYDGVSVSRDLHVGDQLTASKIFARDGITSYDDIYTSKSLRSNGGLTCDGAANFFGNVFVGGGFEVSGLKLFVEPHPTDTNKEIAYIAMEGPEAVTFVRGTTNLTNGELTLTLPDHFSLVTADAGITVQLTPRGQFLQLYVAESTAHQVVIREAQGKNGQFDYLVQGVRKGYENHQPIRPKRR